MGSVAWHSEMECEVAVRKAGRVVQDRELCMRLQREIAILQALRHENVTAPPPTHTHTRAHHDHHPHTHIHALPCSLRVASGS
jgi:hypothetical protein